MDEALFLFSLLSLFISSLLPLPRFSRSAFQRQSCRPRSQLGLHIDLPFLDLFPLRLGPPSKFDQDAGQTVDAGLQRGNLALLLGDGAVTVREGVHDSAGSSKTGLDGAGGGRQVFGVQGCQRLAMTMVMAVTGFVTVSTDLEESGGRCRL